MSTTEEKIHNFRLRVPVSDEKVVAFVKQQHNLSTSLRLLIQRYVDEHGCVDVMSSSLDGGVRQAPVTQSVQASVNQLQAVDNTATQAAAQIAAMQGTPTSSLQDLLNR